MAGRGRKGHCPSHLGQHMLGTRHIVVDVFSWVLKEALNDFTNGFGEAVRGPRLEWGAPTKGAVPAAFACCPTSSFTRDATNLDFHKTSQL